MTDDRRKQIKANRDDTRPLMSDLLIKQRRAADAVNAERVAVGLPPKSLVSDALVRSVERHSAAV